MADFVYIANAALDKIGQNQIVSLDDATPAAKKCKIHLFPAIREVLKLGRWKAAQQQAVLAQLTDAPAFGWTLAYQLPNDYLRMVLFNDDDPQNVTTPVYDIQGTKLLTDETVARLTYICDLTMAPNSIGVAGPDLIELFALCLAAKFAWAFQQNDEVKKSLKNEYLLARRMALAADAKETKTPLINRLHDSEWLRERRFSTNA